MVARPYDPLFAAKRTLYDPDAGRAGQETQGPAESLPKDAARFDPGKIHIWDVKDLRLYRVLRMDRRGAQRFEIGGYFAPVSRPKLARNFLHHPSEFFPVSVAP